MTLLSILLVSKTGEVHATNIKEFAEEDLFKRAGFKSSADFCERTVFRSDAKTVHVFGKITGRAGQENKYEFPPPIDKTLFFGTVLLLAKTVDDEKPTGLSVEEWETMYDAFMGGFEDLGTEDTSTDEDDAQEAVKSGHKLTRDGFVKDGFVVDDDDLDEVDEEDEEEDDDDDVENVVVVKPTKKPQQRKKAPSQTAEQVFVAATEALLECSQELSEEEYEA